MKGPSIVIHPHPHYDYCENYLVYQYRRPPNLPEGILWKLNGGDKSSRLIRIPSSRLDPLAMCNVDYGGEGGGEGTARRQEIAVNDANIQARRNLFECQLCNRFFLTEDKLRLHHRRMHTIQKKSRVCNICGDAFKSLQALHYHNSSKHSLEKKFQCTICEKRFILNYQLTVHMRSHTGERPFECQVCHKRFDIFSNLTVHMRIHTGEKPFKCPKCDNAYKQFVALENHFVSKKNYDDIICMNTSGAFRSFRKIIDLSFVRFRCGHIKERNWRDIRRSPRGTLSHHRLAN